MLDEEIQEICAKEKLMYFSDLPLEDIRRINATAKAGFIKAQLKTKEYFDYLETRYSTGKST